MCVEEVERKALELWTLCVWARTYVVHVANRGDDSRAVDLGGYGRRLAGMARWVRSLGKVSMSTLIEVVMVGLSGLVDVGLCVCLSCIDFESFPGC